MATGVADVVVAGGVVVVAGGVVVVAGGVVVVAGVDIVPGVIGLAAALNLGRGSPNL